MRDQAHPTKRGKPNVHQHFTGHRHYDIPGWLQPSLRVTVGKPARAGPKETNASFDVGRSPSMGFGPNTSIYGGVIPAHRK